MISVLAMVFPRLYRVPTSKDLSSPHVRASVVNRTTEHTICLYWPQRNLMPINALLLPEFDYEMQTTRNTLERVPFDKQDFVPHPKSMPLGSLAPHVAELAGFGATVYTTPELDFGSGAPRSRPPFELAGLLKAFDENAAKARAALASLKDDAWTQPWKLSFQGKP